MSQSDSDTVKNMDVYEDMSVVVEMSVGGGLS